MKGRIKDSELDALISMLDEPNDLVYKKVRERILDYGINAVAQLEKSWDNSFDNLLQDRIGEIIHILRKNYLKTELTEWKNNDRFNLLRGFYLASKFAYPEITYPEISEKVEKIVRDIWLELNNNLTALEKIKVLNHIFFDIYGFSGSKGKNDPPENLFINRILESKTGNDLTIGILMIILSQKLDMPVYGVNLPQHFILAYADEIHENLFSNPDENEILFYINPFNKGTVFTRREIEVFIKHLKLKPSSAFYTPCDNIAILRRLFDSIILSYRKQGRLDKAGELKSLSALLR